MPSNRNVSFEGGVWTELTETDVESLRVQNLSGYPATLQRSGENQPDSDGGAIVLQLGQIIYNDKLEDLWPGGAGGRVWVWADENYGGKMSVSHA